MADAIYHDMPKDITRIIGIGGGTIMDLCKLFALEKVSPVVDLFEGKTEIKRERISTRPDDLRYWQWSYECFRYGFD